MLAYVADEQLGVYMKYIFILILYSLSLSAFAQETTIELNSNKINVATSHANVIRTNKTPDIVKISFSVPMNNTVCERYETRMVLRTSGAYCGYDIITRRIRIGKVCIETNPGNGKCMRWGERYRTETVRRPRTCLVPETFCAEYGTSTSFIKDTMKIKFNDLPALGDSESETFNISARQKRHGSSDVVYEIIPVQTLREYEVVQKKLLFLFKRDFFVVQEK